MINRYFIEKSGNFPFDDGLPNVNAPEIGRFLSRDGQELFLLKGYAGTGKSSLIGGWSALEPHRAEGGIVGSRTAAKVFSGYGAAGFHHP